MGSVSKNWESMPSPLVSHAGTNSPSHMASDSNELINPNLASGRMWQKKVDMEVWREEVVHDNLSSGMQLKIVDTKA
jgi:hypothetical protein